MKKELKWGETPWDGLDRDELLREVQRMASALQSANSVLRMTKDLSTFWTVGTGAAALEKVDQALARLADYESENVYRAFYRYADDLLFTRPPGSDLIGFGWAVCPVCGRMYGETSGGKSAVGTACGDRLGLSCPGVLRPIEWSDLR